MEEKTTSFWVWVKIHKKQLILAGISITAIVGIILIIKNKDDLLELWVSLKKSIAKIPDSTFVTVPAGQESISKIDTEIVRRSYNLPQTPFDVSSHIRNLSGGRQHSIEKAIEAVELGIVLQPNQTIVDSYSKYEA